MATSHFEFTNHERFILNRHKEPYAKDLDQAKEFWGTALRCEYLDQLLTTPDVQFVGPISFDGNSNMMVTLKRDKLHPASFDLLPATFLAKDGHAFGSLEVAASQSNATVRLNMPLPENLRKTTNTLYSAKGDEIGDITYRRERLETSVLTFTNAEGVISTNFVTNAVPLAHEAASSTPPPTLPPAGRQTDVPTIEAPAAALPGNTTTNLIAMIHLNQKNLAEIHKTLTNRYAQMMRNYKELDSDRVFELYVNSLARAYDPHSDFMGHTSAENFDIQMKLSLFGIGALLGKDTDYCKIIELKEGPAKKSGKIHENDRIVAVAQTNAEPVDLEGMTLDKIVEMIRGPKGTQVTLTVIPSDAVDASVRKQVTLIRDEIKLEDQEVKARLYEKTNTAAAVSRVGVINIPSFYADNERPSAMLSPADASTKAGRLLLIRASLPQNLDDNAVYWVQEAGPGVFKLKDTLSCSPGKSALIAETQVPCGSVFVNKPSQTGGDLISQQDLPDDGPKSMTADVARLIKRLKKENVSGLILDLRHNGGGYLEEAVRLTGLFIPPGPVVQTKDPISGEVMGQSSLLPPIYDGPLIILTSRLSASASEIMAGALQDYNRALIVGDHSTFGKGTVQTKQGLQPFLIQYQRRKHMPYDTKYDPGDLKITIKKFYRASGASTQLKGVVSDIELPSRLNADTNDVGESALPEALPWDEVSPADLVNLHCVQPYLADLKERSRQRVAGSKDFSYIQEDIAEFLKQQADKSVSLNLTERQAEQKTNTTRIDAIKKEIASRKKSDERIYELTLENIDLPALQPLAVKTNSAAATIESSFDDDSDAEPASDSQVDPALDEARHILADYIALVNKKPFISKAP